MSGAQRTSGPIGVAIVILVGIAAALRWPASPEPVLWNDEAWRWLAIQGSDSLGSLLAFCERNDFWLLPHEWGLGRIGTAWLGERPLAVRIWPLLAGSASVVVAFLAGARLAGPVAGLVAAMLLALGPGFVVHGREFKPYSLDCLLALGAVALAMPRPSGRRGEASLTVFLGVYALSSLSFVFVYPAVVLTRVLHAGARRVRDLAMLALPGVLFVANYFLLLAPMASGTSHPQQFWTRYYPRSLDNLAFLFLEQAPRALDTYLLPGWPVFLICLLATLVLSWRRRDGVALLLLGPFVVHFFVSALGIYPLFGRPSTFLFALGALVVGVGFGAAARSGLRRWPGLRPEPAALASVLVIALVASTRSVPSVYPIPERTLRPMRDALAAARRWPPDMGRRAMTALAEGYRPGDAVMMGNHMHYTFLAHRETLLAGIPWLAKEGGLGLADRTLLKDQTSERLCKSFREVRRRQPFSGDVWLLGSMNVAPEIYEDVFSRLGPLEFVVREPAQALLRVRVADPAKELPCLGWSSADFSLTSSGSWTIHRLPVQHFPAFFQMSFELEAPVDRAYELEVRLLRPEPAAPLAARPFRRLPNGRFLLTHRSFGDDRTEPGSAPVGAVEFRLRPAGGAPVSVVVRDLRVN